MEKNFTHLTPTGDANMVDVSEKKETPREAIAFTKVILSEEIINKLQNDEIQTKKGAVFQTAILAGIMGAKRTSELIPLCHPIALDKCSVDIKVNNNKEVEIKCLAKTSGKTGVEMEALTGATIAALTIYDMCKGFSHEIEITETKLLKKTGGKSDYSAT